MIKKIIAELGEPLLVSHDAPLKPDEAWFQGAWRSLACQMCGVCCHSSLVPIGQTDFDSFHKGLGLKISKDIFARMFLQNVDTNGSTYTIETEQYGGRCMFLEKKEAFSCVIWDRRASVCAEFFCWPMEQFALYEKGGEQDMFDENEEWLDNFSVLLHRIIEETTETLFPDDRSGYFRNKNRDSSESYYTVHLDEF